MNVDNHGIVIQPEKYQMWSAELTGNTDDTGGIYVFLFAPDNKLQEAIFVPEGAHAPPKSIINQPELQVYIADFGKEKDDIS